MKKVLSTALVLGALYGTAGAAPITSPIYAPEAGKILTDVKVGYTTSEFDKNPFDEKKELEQSWNIDLAGKLGLTDAIALNFGFDFDFARKVRDDDASARFTDFYFGLTGRVFEIDANKFDVIFNVGQKSDYIYGNDQAYVDLALRYGLDLDMYNLGLSAGVNYVDTYKMGSYKLERGLAFKFALENEFIFTEELTMGLDLFYAINGKTEEKELGALESRVKTHSEYGFNVDANYALNRNNFVGAYFGMALGNLKYEDQMGEWKDPTEYKFGVKYVSQF